MTKRPDMTGDTYADIVVWRWVRAKMRWVAVLKDNTELRVELQRLGRRSFWNVSVWGEEVYRLPGYYPNPDAGQKAAVTRYKQARAARSVVAAARNASVALLTVTERKAGVPADVEPEVTIFARRELPVCDKCGWSITYPPNHVRECQPEAGALAKRLLATLAPIKGTMHGYGYGAVAFTLAAGHTLVFDVSPDLTLRLAHVFVDSLPEDHVIKMVRAVEEALR